MSNLNKLKFKHWHLEQDVDGFLFAYADRAKEAVNSLSTEMLLELAKGKHQLTFAIDRTVRERLSLEMIGKEGVTGAGQFVLNR